MLDREKFILTLWDKVKIGIGIMCVLLVFVQLSAASKMIRENHTDVKMISPEQYNDLQYGDEVAAEIKKDDIITDFLGKNNEMDYYLIRVNDEHAVAVKMPFGSPCSAAMRDMMNGGRESLLYKGRVNIIPDSDMGVINLLAISGDLLAKKGMSRHVDEVILKYMIDIAVYEEMSGTKYIIATIVGAVLMLAAAVWAFWKPFKKIGLSYAARLGKVDLELIKKEDLSVEQDWFTDETLKQDYLENLPKKEIDKNFQTVDFYESGVNDEGNFYVKKKIGLEKKSPNDDEGFEHKHMNY